MAETLCKNCRRPIRRSNYADGLGTGWTHIDGIEFNGNDHCRVTYAEPEPSDSQTGTDHVR